MPGGRNPGERDSAWSHASPIDTRDPAFSLADFNAVAAQARQDASRAPAEATPVGDVLRATADGFGRGFGQEPIGLGKPTRDALQRASIMAPADGGGSLLQNLNSRLIDAVAAPVDAAVRTAAGLLGAYQAGVAEAGNAIRQPQLGRDLAALPEVFPLGVRSGMLKPGSGIATAETLASKCTLIYDPPQVAPQPFAADYPNGAMADGTGRLLADVDGRPLSAPHVAGRTMVGAGEEAIAPMGVDAIATGLTGKGVAQVASRTLPRNVVGALVKEKNPQTGVTERSVVVDRSLDPGSMTRVAAHEVGHAIDDVAGNISVSGLNAELMPLYDRLNNAQTWGPRVTPTSDGYGKLSEQHRELMAEAIRAYMTDPNWMKTVAPQTAARIRDAVNGHPTLSKVIQFNAAGGLAYGFSQPDERQNDGGTGR